MSDDVKILSRTDFIKKLDSFKREIVPLQMGGAVYVAELSAAQVLTYNERLQGLQTKGKKKVDPSTSVELMALMVSMAVCDEQGAPLFSEEDAKKLMRANLNDLLTLSIKAMELSGMSGDAVQEVAANLKKARNSGSASRSRKS
jgi:hypothetical protein